MAAYLVTYDLKKPGQDYKNLIDELKRSTWWHCLESTWLVIRSESMEDLSATLRKHIDQNDRLLIMHARRPVVGWLSQDCWDWINQNVPF